MVKPVPLLGIKSLISLVILSLKFVYGPYREPSVIQNFTVQAYFFFKQMCFTTTFNNLWCDLKYDENNMNFFVSKLTAVLQIQRHAFAV